MKNQLINDLSTRIYSNPKFLQDYNQLVKRVLSTSSQELFSQEQIKRLLESASILSLSNNPIHQKLAFKITVFLLNSFKNEYKIIPYASEIILTRLGDLPTIEHMFNEKDGGDSFSYFHDAENSSFAFLNFPEICAKKILNQFEIFPNDKLTLTNFQSQILRSLLKGENISFSAPTSAGKSFIVHNYIVHNLLDKDQYTAVYLVPTKSLIAEVQRSILDILKKLKANMPEIAVVNSAERLNTDQYQNVQKRVLVLTQERLQYVLSHNPEFNVNLLVVDEAQKVKEEERGVVLEDVIGDLIRKNPVLQTVFISPYIGNSEKFWNLFDIKQNIRSISVSKTPVGQNVFYVNLDNHRATISILSEEFNREVIELEQIPMTTKVPTAQFRIKSWIVNNLLKGTGHTLIYCNRPWECILIANEISEDRESFELTEELTLAIDFVKSHVHEEYYLADHLRSGVGYHYGRMPQFVRYVVRELFDKKQIDYLCCTSTLLEGVNLPAKNIVLHKPKSGLQTAMDKYTIKNLAGRAGRLGKDYYGNVYCVNIDDWESGADAFDEELETVESAIEKTVTSKIDELIAHLQSYTIPTQGTKGVAAVATSLIMKQLRDPQLNSIDELKRKYPKVSEEKLTTIKYSLEKIVQDISKLDKDIILRNTSIDPRLQYELYLYLKKPNNIVLPPEPYYEEFYKDLEKIFELLQRFIFKDIGGESYKFFAYVANEWILQRPYKSIIENRLSFERDKKKNLSKEEINKIIDKIDDVIESTLKYEFTRGLRCYCDIVNLIQEKRHSIEKFSMKIPDYLETGAYDEKVFLLLDLGLSRNSAISISNLMQDNVKTVKNAIDWIKSHQNKVKEILHPLMYKELEQLLTDQGN